ncbi:MAG: hypothetical protein HY902_17750 [Deltaproteobacteria bacterium]|nr:hypothetical protein [Deltaproteobacteria bacterium]
MAWLAMALAARPASAQVPPGDAAIGRRWFGGPLQATPLGHDAADEATSADACAKCHPAIAAQWRSSRHGQAWPDPVFQQAYQREPEAPCRRCHAPLAGGAVPSGRAERDSIDCAVCHVRGGQILTSDRRRNGVQAPHGVIRTADLGTPGYCSGCHQFGFLGFPRDKRRGPFETDELQQATLAEWQSSRAAAQGLTCPDCHMPKVAVDGGIAVASHAFAATTAETLRSAVAATVQSDARAGTLTWTVELTAKHAGHKVPTGDVFRRLQWCLFEPAGKVVATLDYGRTWRSRRAVDRRNGPYLSRTLVRDTRLPADGTPVTRAAQVADLPGLWRWRLDYVRSTLPTIPKHSQCDDGERTLLHQGQVDVPAPGAPALGVP